MTTFHNKTVANKRFQLCAELGLSTATDILDSMFLVCLRNVQP